MDTILDKLYSYFVNYGLNFIAAILILVVGRWIAGFLAKLIEKVMNQATVDKTLSSFVRHLVYMGTMAFVIIAAVNKLGVETTSIVAVIGAAGLAVGLALQGSLANFAAGIMLIIFKPFKVGDLVEIDSITGTVEELQIFNTIISTLDNKKVVFPNSKVTSDKIVNLSGVEKRRVDLIFGISYSDDIKTAKQALEHVVGNHDLVLKDPKPVIAVSELGDSSVNLVCRPWVKPENYWSVYFDLIENGKLELERRGITIPFPQRDVHIYKQT